MHHNDIYEYNLTNTWG